MTDGIEEDAAPEESLLPDGVEDELKSKWGKLLVFELDHLGVFAFRKGTQASTDRLVDKMTDDKGSKSAAMREFVLTSLCWPVADNGKPDWKKAEELFREVPNLPQDLLGDIRDLAPKVDIKKR